MSPSPAASGRTRLTKRCEHSWSFKRKWAATAIVSAFTFISPVSSSMIAPASDALAADLGISNSVIIALTTSVFVLAYGAFVGRHVRNTHTDGNSLRTSVSRPAQ